MLESRIHYRALPKPIASHIVECSGAASPTPTSPSIPYPKLTRPIFPLDPK